MLNMLMIEETPWLDVIAGLVAVYIIYVTRRIWWGGDN